MEEELVPTPERVDEWPLPVMGSSSSSSSTAWRFFDRRNLNMLAVICGEDTL